MPDKLTDNEIVKALRSWLEEIRKARKAYLEKVNELHYPSMRYEYLLSDTIHEINRLQAENERLSQFGGILLRNGSELFKEIQTAKAEAYKECIEKAKEEINEALKSNYKARAEREQSIPIFTENEFWNYCTGKIDCLRGIDDFLDNLLKEMTGE